MEQTRHPHPIQRQKRASLLGPGAGPQAAPAGIATVTHGVYAEQIPVVDLTVGQVRARYADRFDIDPQSVALLDGAQVDENAVVGEGQVLSFVRRAGEKG